VQKKLKIKNFGEHIVGVSIGEVSFLTTNKELETLKNKLSNKEEFKINSLTGKKVSFYVSEHFNAYVISDSHTGNTALMEFDEE
jgi:hypothetical protein